MNESLFQPFGLEVDLSTYIILYILFSLLISLFVKCALISFPLHTSIACQTLTYYKID